MSKVVKGSLFWTSRPPWTSSALRRLCFVRCIAFNGSLTCGREWQSGPPCASSLMHLSVNRPTAIAFRFSSKRMLPRLRPSSHLSLPLFSFSNQALLSLVFFRFFPFIPVDSGSLPSTFLTGKPSLLLQFQYTILGFFIQQRALFLSLVRHHVFAFDSTLFRRTRCFFAPGHCSSHVWIR